MARFDILSANGTVRYNGAPTYNGVFGRASYLEFQQIASPVPIAWEVGDYIDYPRTGLRYKLYSIPQPERHAKSGKRGDSIIYRNVQLFAATKELEICPFNDLVIGDNLIHYSSQPDVNTYENVRGIADRIQANLDAFYGEGRWRIDLYEADADVAAVMDEAKEFSVSDGTCMSALDAIRDTWKGIGWIHTHENGVDVITIGRPNVQNGDNSTDLFTYGRGNGLTVLATSLSSQNELATRIYPFGSTRNMISRYYNSKTAIKDHESVYIPNLMLPLTDWGLTDGLRDPRLAYLENAEAAARFGIRVKRIYFDGSGDYEEIYPSIGGVTAKNIRDAKTAAGDSSYVPSTTEYPDGERMDVLRGATNPLDNGIMGVDGQKYVEVLNGTGHSGYVERTDIITRMGVAYRYSDTFGVATVTGGGLVTVKSDYEQIITLPKDSSPEVVYRINVYCDGALVQNKVVAPEILGTDTSRAFRLKFPDITFTLKEGGQMSVVVVAEVSAVPGTQYRDYAPSAGLTYEVQKSFSDTFSVKLKQIGFDISKQQSSISDGLCTLNLKSGFCAGRDFVVKSVSYNASDDSWTAVCYRQEDSSLGQYFPNSIYPVAEGDQFVLTDLEMPELYIGMASARLKDAATEALAKLSTPRIIYEPEIDAKVVAEYGDVLREGMYMAVGDSELIGDSPVYVLIDTLTIYENEANIPTYKVSLRDERYENTISRLTGEISRLNAQRRASMYDEARSRYRNDAAGEDFGEPGVTLSYDGNTFSYADASTVNPSQIAVLANVRAIPSPTYLWQYFDGTDWQPIAGGTETFETLSVTPDNSDYFGGDELVANIRCRVASGSSSYYSDVLTVTKIVGGAGSSSITMMLFRRADPAPTTKPTGNLTYDFATDTLSGTEASFNGWSREFPTSSDPCYVIFATKTSSAGTAVFEPGDWGDIRPYVANGEDGAPGTPGTPGAPGTPGQDACILELDPPVFQIPTDASLVIPAGTVLPSGKATLYKGNAPATGVTYSLETTPVIYLDGVPYYLNAAITPETIGGVVYVWEYADAEGNTILLSEREDLIWDGDEAREDFTPSTEDAGVTINSTTGQITVTSGFSFYGADIRRVRVNALDSTPTLFQATLTISAQKQGVAGRNGQDGQNGTNGTNGSNGYSSQRVAIYKRSSSSVPATPSENLGYSIPRGVITSGDLDGWSLSVPSGSSPCYVSYNYYSTNSGGNIVALQSENWTSPVILAENGKDPYIVTSDHPVVSIPATNSGAIITPTPSVSVQCRLMKGGYAVVADGWSMEDIYIIIDGERYACTGYEPEMPDYPYVWDGLVSHFNIYTTTRQPNVGDAYFDEGEVQHEIESVENIVSGLSISSSGLITGTPTYIGGDSVTVKVISYKDGSHIPYYLTVTKNKVGERGLAGKVMRGVSTYSSTPGAPYQGLDDTDPTHIYYDVVTRNDTLYLCKVSSYNGHAAAWYEPGVTSGWQNVWEVATNFKFVATDLLFAANAYIQYLTNMGFYLKDGQGNIVGGAQGSDTYIFWAGDDDPTTAPFSVDKDGKVVATDGTFKGTIQAENGYFNGRLMLPFVEINSNHTLSASDSSSIRIPARLAAGASNGYVLTLPNSSDFNGWVLNVYVSPVFARMDGAGEFAGRILVPEKSTLPSLSTINQYYASAIRTRLGGFFQFMCVNAQWVLINYNAAEVSFEEYTE